MKNQIWEYKIGVEPFGFIPLAILLAVFGGVSIWLHISNNGAFLFTDLLTAFVLIITVYSIYKYMFVKILVGETGFYHQTKPGNGKYYDYADITEAWESSGKTANGMESYYFCYKTTDGQIIKFPFTASQSDGIEYLLAQINCESENTDGEDTYE